MMTNTPPWFRARHYLHFDRPVGPAKAAQVATDPTQVVRHSFYPLISFEIGKKKVRKNASTGKVEVETKKRPIGYVAHMDAHILSYYAYVLADLYERHIQIADFRESVLAFRSLGKSNIDFAKDAFDTIRLRGESSAIALDISGFFDNLDHLQLKHAIQDLLGVSRLSDDYWAVFRRATKYSYVEKDQIYKALGVSSSNPRMAGPRLCTPKDFRAVINDGGLIKTNDNDFGIPQGTPISALLSNIYMMDFDKAVHSAVTEQGGAYFRYCDDILVVVPHEFESGVAGMVQNEIRKLKLKINSKKTIISRFTKKGSEIFADKPMQYLGFLFDGSKVVIRSSALAKYSERMKRGVKLASATRHKVNQVRARRGLPARGIFKKKLYSRYSHLGKRNFVTYGHRAAETFNSQAIRRQLKPLWSRLEKEIDKYK